MNLGDLLHFREVKPCYFLHDITDENSAVCVIKSSIKMFVRFCFGSGFGPKLQMETFVCIQMNF